MCLGLTMKLPTQHQLLVAPNEDVHTLHELMLACIEPAMHILQSLQHFMHTREPMDRSGTMHIKTDMHSIEANDEADHTKIVLHNIVRQLLVLVGILWFGNTIA